MVEKGVDIMMATDLLQFAWQGVYDTAILVTGDGDFTYAVQAVKNLGTFVEIAAFSANVSSDLAQVADDRHFLVREFFSDLWGTNSGMSAKRRRFRGKRLHGPLPQQTQDQPAGQGQQPQVPFHPIPTPLV